MDTPKQRLKHSPGNTIRAFLLVLTAIGLSDGYASGNSGYWLLAGGSLLTFSLFTPDMFSKQKEAQKY